MRWKIAIASCIACLALDAAVSTAETNWVGIHGGLAMPTGDMSDAADMGFDVGASGTWMFAPTWGIGADVDYFMWSGKDDVVPAGDLSYSAIMGGGHLMVMIPSESAIRPYLKGGAGAYNFTAKLEDAGPGIDFDESETNFGFNIGAGLNWMASPTMGWGLSGTYHSIQEDSNPVNFFTINLNLMFGMGGPQ